MYGSAVDREVMKDKRRSISDLWAMSGAFLERKRLNVQVHFEEKKKRKC